MKNFWNSKAKEDAQFYIATWRGYKNASLDGFFLSSQEALSYVPEAHFTLLPGQKMLEIGCGMGRMTYGFAQLFDEVHGVDVSGEMVKLANKHLVKFNNIFISENNGKDLKLYPDGMFNFVFSFIVFQHIPDKEVINNYILEAARVMTGNGVFYFQVNGLPDHDISTNKPILFIKRVYRKYFRKPIVTVRRKINRQPCGFEEPEWTGSNFSKEEISNLCSSAGLDVVNVTGENSQYMWITARKPSSYI